jgi:hypothetical protein
MATWVFEIDTAPAVVGVELTGERHSWVGPVLDSAINQALVDLIEALVIDEKGIMLHLDIVDDRLGELQEHAAIECHQRERAPNGRFVQTEQLGKERG